MFRSPRDYALLCAAAEAVPAPEWAFAGPTFHATLTEDADGGVTIVVRGSTSALDWAADFSPLGPRWYDHPALGAVHAGFDATTDECLPEVFRACSGRRVRLSGHSKGGAEAEVLAAKLVAAGIAVDELVTFGTPRWLCRDNTEASRWLSGVGVSLSYRHYLDVVTQAPWWMRHPDGREPARVGTGRWWQPWLPYPGWAQMHHAAAYAASVPS